MARKTVQKEEKNIVKTEVSNAETNVENTKIENKENNLEDLKNILQDLKTVLTNLGVNISELEVSLSTPKADKEEIQKEDTPKDNDTLLISEIQNKVILPYKIEDVEKIIDTNKKYNTIQEVIDGEYTLPLNKYKNSSKSRFRESYDLMRKKEKASIFDSLSIATEMVFNGSLNPAVITACNNLEELDTYVKCLNSNELDKFNFFKVKYEIMPQKQ